MEKMNARSLINSWDLITESLSPSQSRHGGKVERIRELAGLSLLSGRREYWESAVSLAEYAESKPRKNEDVIEEVFRGLEGDVSTPEANEFLEYAGTIVTIPRQTLQSATRSLSLLVGPREFAPMADAITRLKICLDLFPNDPVGFDNCLNG